LQNENRISVLGLALLADGMSTAVAEDDVDKQIAHARAAAPDAVSADATIVINGEVAVEGSNGWTCMPDTMPKELLEGMNDDPSTGGPYVMWGDTDYAHIMVPVE